MRVVAIGLTTAALLGAGCGKRGGPTDAAPEYQVEWLSNTAPAEMQAGKEYRITVELKNAGAISWPASQTQDADPKKANEVALCYHWLAGQEDKAVVWDGKRTYLPKNVEPGETVVVDRMVVVAPEKPGSYRLQLTLIQERVGWFEISGANSTIVPVTVR